MLLHKRKQAQLSIAYPPLNLVSMCNVLAHKKKDDINKGIYKKCKRKQRTYTRDILMMILKVFGKLMRIP